MRIPGGHTSAARGLLISCACCVSPPTLQQPKQASPERVGEYSQTPLFYRALWKSVKQNAFWAALGEQSLQPLRTRSHTKESHCTKDFLRDTSCPWWLKVLSFWASCARIPPDSGGTHAEASTYRFVLPARPRLVRLRANQKIRHEEGV